MDDEAANVLAMSSEETLVVPESVVNNDFHELFILLPLCVLGLPDEPCWFFDTDRTRIARTERDPELV